MSRFARLPGTGSACIIRGASGTCLRLSDLSCRRRRIVTVSVTVTLMFSILVPGPGPGELSPILRVGKAACHSEHAS